MINYKLPETVASKRMLDMAGVTYRRFVPRMASLVIDFGTIDEVAAKMEDASINEEEKESESQN